MLILTTFKTSAFLDPCIPVYCTEKTKVLAKAMTDVSVSGVDDQYYKVAKKVAVKQKPVLFKTLCPGNVLAAKKKKKNCRLSKILKLNSSLRMISLQRIEYS